MDADALLAAIAFPAQATLIGRLALTLGGTDYQAAYDDVLDITWTTNANINSIDTNDYRSQQTHCIQFARPGLKTAGANRIEQQLFG
ncbi:MAG: hypothetical protein ACI9DC_004951 [Gammaproteobacteria bacterium]|jgi:hypothetical protein